MKAIFAEDWNTLEYILEESGGDMELLWDEPISFIPETKDQDEAESKEDTFCGSGQGGWLKAYNPQSKSDFFQVYVSISKPKNRRARRFTATLLELRGEGWDLVQFNFNHE
eukprot:TRINITY_DN478_c0_g1::TRINITY_DN478_c0_g1_i1::g.2493::m.2493 TRINITY_DN478_c0_g1::TRINITY_DN478_c0_g1_i1::g.2493  ORF type:complete len:111 (+),score=3.01 TRINITY_DN478_c0_g1_i1:71-403(+)